jgi:hypothetical protein
MAICERARLGYRFVTVNFILAGIILILVAILSFLILRKKTAKPQTAEPDLVVKMKFTQAKVHRAPDIDICTVTTLPIGYTKVVDAGILPISAVLNSVVAGLPYTSGLYSAEILFRKRCTAA